MYIEDSCSFQIIRIKMQTTSSQMISQELISINAWVEETEKIINSQASFDTFQPAEVEEIITRFQAVLGSGLNAQQVSEMTRAIGLLLFVTKNLRNLRDLLVTLLQDLLASYLASDSIDQLSRLVF